MANSNIKTNIIFNSEEEKLFKKYLEEYNELYEKILILSPNDFIQSMIKRVEITLKDKINGFSYFSKTKIKEFIIEKIYCHDYKYALFAKKNILKRNTIEIYSHYFNNKIIPHCENDQKDNYYIHSCGEKFQTYKYNPINYLDLIKKSQKKINNTESSYLLYCISCDYIYKSDLIKFKCYSSKEDFYSKIIDENNLNNNQFATWKKYHCNIIINDAMKCQKCNENLYYLKDKNNIFCKKCNIEFDPKEIKWKCIKCKVEFTSEVKIFNSLEYKNMKICVKETIINKKKAKPKYLGCECKYNFKNIDFNHKKNCKGKLYLGVLNDKKVVVCEKCESLGIFDDYIWTCPICLKRFKINKTPEKKIDNIKNNNNNNDNKKEIVKIFNYSNSNWNINKKNNFVIYKSPRINNKNLLSEKNNSSEKEKEIKTDIKKIKYLSRNNSASKLNMNRKFPTGLPTPSKLIKDIKNNYNIKLDIKLNNRNIPKYSPDIFHNKFKSKLLNNKIFSSNNNLNCQRRKFISNIDLTGIKNMNNLYDKYFGTSPDNKICESKNNNKLITKKNEIKKNILTDIDLSNKINNNIKHKKNDVNNYCNIISKASNNYDIKNILNRKRSNSGYNRSNLNIDEKIPYNNNISKNKIIINANKIPFKKNIFLHRINSFNNRREESTSCDSKEQKTKDNINIHIIQHKNKSKKIIPGQLNINNYIIKKQIGEGSFGQIFLVEDKLNHNKYALKKIIAGSKSDINSIQKEYQILLDIQNTIQNINVVNIYGLKKIKLDMTTHVLYVLIELASTDWEKEILERKTRKNYYTEKELIETLSGLIKSLSILQKQNISHRDIKPQNILVFNDKDNKLKKIYKLADFGEAKELLKDDKPTNRQTLRGTELYMSPILFYALRSKKSKNYIKHNPFKSDVFSFGLCALFASTLCFESLYDVRELKSNISLTVVVKKYLKNRYSNDFINLITKMLDINEVTRKDFIELENELNKLEK